MTLALGTSDLAREKPSAIVVVSSRIAWGIAIAFAIPRRRSTHRASIEMSTQFDSVWLHPSSRRPIPKKSTPTEKSNIWSDCEA